MDSLAQNPTRMEQLQAEDARLRQLQAAHLQAKGLAGSGVQQNNMVYDNIGNRVPPGLLDRLLQALPGQSHPTQGRPKMGDYIY